MGEWADYAHKKFHSELGTKRVQEELELLRHSQMVAGAERRWKDLTKFVSAEVADFNRLMGREFLTIHIFENELTVGAPKLQLKALLDLRTPSIDAEYREAGSYGRDGIVDEDTFRFTREDDNVSIANSNGQALSVERVGAELLNPLII